MTECSICQTDMQHLSFVKDHAEDDCDVDTPDGPPVFRLRCGHAFHTACLCRALRADAGCPLCRHTTGHTLTLTIDADGLVVQDTDDIHTQPELLQDITQATELVTTLMDVRRHRDVQKLREKINKQKQAYRRLEIKLCKERADCIDSCLHNFSERNRATFLQQRAKIQRSLHKLRVAELNVLQCALEPEKYDSMVATMQRISPDEYTVENTVGNGGAFGPLRKTFWKRI
jgi:hypothetical protein